MPKSHMSRKALDTRRKANVREIIEEHESRLSQVRTNIANARAPVK